MLVREAGAGGGWRALLESVQVARGGLLRRGRVRLLALSPANVTDDTLTVRSHRLLPNSLTLPNG